MNRDRDPAHPTREELRETAASEGLMATEEETDPAFEDDPEPAAQGGLPPNRSMPSSTVIPVLVCAEVATAVEWLCDTFGLTERWRAGAHIAQLSLSEGAVILTEQRVGQGFESPDTAELRPPRPEEVTHSVMVRVPDADGHHERARDRGARILQPPADHPFGERQYTAEDLDGHRWTFSQTIADVAPEGWGGTVATSR